MAHPKQSIALITGASRGIGKAIALKLAVDGFSIALSGRDEVCLKAVKDEIVSQGGRAFIFPLDIAKTIDAPKNLIASVVKEFGCLDVLVNNAGLAHACLFEDTRADDFDRIMTLNVKVPMLLTQAAIPYLEKSTVATVVNISSVVGVRPYQNQSLYSASKHALNGLMKAAAKELQGKGIRVHLVSPGGVSTEMIRQTRPDLDAESLIQPAEVANAVAFLLGFNGAGAIDEIRLRRNNNEPFA